MDVVVGIDDRGNIDFGISPSGSLSFPPSDKLAARGVMLLDENDCIRSVDPGLCSLLGVKRSELLGRKRLDAFGEIARTRFVDSEAFKASVEWLLQHPDEILEDTWELAYPVQRILHRYSAPVHDEKERRIGRIEVYSDITRRRELEERVRQAYDELRMMQEQLVQSEKLRAIGEIASGIAHDFNNALGVILGNAQLLGKNIHNPTDVERLKSIERAALDAAETVRRIRQFTKQEKAENPVLLNLGELVTEVVNMLKPVWQDSVQVDGKGIEVKVEEKSQAFVMGVAAEIREVLTNILLNAIQAMPVGGRIHASVGLDDDVAWVKIADTGIGMTEEVRKRIFDPFFTTRGVEGTGLGMSVAYGIISRHGGTISVESESGVGTAVTIFLPSAAENMSQTEEDVCVGTTNAQPARVLVVDDEEMFGQVIAQMLGECGYTSCVVQSGVEAVETFQKDNFDLVLTDLGMPEMSGWQVAQIVKEIRPDVPVVLLTGWGSSLDVDQIADSQIDGMLAKPVKMADLSNTISAALKRKGL